MSGQLRALKNRIRGIENTQKITRAMEMVAASKLKRFQNLKRQAEPYELALRGILTRLLNTGTPLTHPLLEEREEKQAALFLITSDTGLCGSYNQNLVEEAKKFLRAASGKPLLVGFGKNGVNALSRAGYAWHQTFTDIKTSRLESSVAGICLLLETLFTEKQVDRVDVIYTHFTGKYTYKATLEKMIPFPLTSTPLPKEEDTGDGVSYIMEPDPETLFARLMPLYFETRIRMILLESLIAEQMARQSAMAQATDNATELMDTLVLLRNKMRQAAITNELIEIVSGSKALQQ